MDEKGQTHLIERQRTHNRSVFARPSGPLSTILLTMARIKPLRGGATTASRGLISRSESVAAGDHTFAHRSQQNSSPIQQSDGWKAAPHGHFQDRGRLSTIRLTIGRSYDKTPHFDRVNISP